MKKILKLVTEDFKLYRKRNRFKIKLPEENKIVEVSANDVYAIIAFTEGFISSSSLELATRHNIPIIFVSIEDNQVSFTENLLEPKYSSIMNMELVKNLALTGNILLNSIICSYINNLNLVLKKLFPHAPHMPSFSKPFDDKIIHKIDQKYAEALSFILKVQQENVEKLIFTARKIFSLGILAFLLREGISPLIPISSYDKFFKFPLLSTLSLEFFPTFSDYPLMKFEILRSSDLKAIVQILHKSLSYEIQTHGRKTLTIRELVFSRVHGMITALRNPLIKYKPIEEEVLQKFLESL